MKRPRPAPFDIAGERAIHRRWREIEAAGDWADTWPAAARLSFERRSVLPEAGDEHGHRRDFGDWPQSRQVAWLSGWSRGFHDRIRCEIEAERERRVKRALS